MRILFPFLFAVVLLVVAGCRTTPAPIPDGASPAEAKAIADAQLSAGNYARAARTYEVLIDDYPRTLEADQAQWLAAESWYLNEDLSLAQEFYEEFFETNPLSNLGELGERMYDIGIRRYEIGKGGIAGLGVLSTAENGLKTLSWITEKLPNGTRADDAWFFIGRARMRGWQFDEAVLNFDQILTRYHQSEWVHEALFLRGISYLEINRGPPYDRDSLIRAKGDFVEYVRLVERTEALRTEYADRLQAAKQNIAEIDERLAAKNVLIADFYQSRERYRAERLYLNNATRRYPETAAAREAEERLAALDPESESAPETEAEEE